MNKAIQNLKKKEFSRSAPRKKGRRKEKRNEGNGSFGAIGKVPISASQFRHYPNIRMYI
ncbi:hypothetical protein HG1285_13132 [Hydrogenivirga sp. 128-5-R1-1]|nr:hypothetical protein HG1285_13132 [Hydrogenivirga sp. 128-5-R1-1]